MTASDSVLRKSSSDLILLGLALVAAASMVYYHLGLFVPRVLEVRAALGLGNGYSFGDDFYPIWLAARKSGAEQRDLYSPEVTRHIQTGLFGRPLDAGIPTDPPADYRQFAYPAFTELLLWPSALCDFSKLRVILAVLFPVLTALTLWLWILALRWRLPPVRFAALALLALCNYPILEALFAEQPGLIVGFLLAAAALALRRSWLSLAGVLMSLTLIKPQMTALAILYLVLWSLASRGRARFLAAFLVTTLLLTGASWVIWPHWIGKWLQVLLGYHRYATPPLVMVLLGGSLGTSLGPLIIAPALLVSVWLAWKARRDTVESLQFWLTLSLLLTLTSVTLLPGQAIYDDVILLPGIFLLLRHWRELRDAGRVSGILLLAGAVVLFWPWVGAFTVVALRAWFTRVWFTAATFDSTAIFSLPIRTAASLPFAVLALLAYAMRINRVRDQAAP